MIDGIIPNVCANCGEDMMTDFQGQDFCDIECAKEFDLMVLEWRSNNIKLEEE